MILGIKLVIMVNSSSNSSKVVWLSLSTHLYKLLLQVDIKLNRTILGYLKSQSKYKHLKTVKINFIFINTKRGIS